MGTRPYLHRWLLFVAALSLAVGALAQEAYYLALQGEGSAAVFLDPGHQCAYITDGGREGERGIRGARIGGRPVLEELLDRGVRQLVITCSHPHRDHTGGLVDLVTNDEHILRFEEVIFVDSPASRSGAERALADLYRERWAEVPEAPRAVHLSAEGRDAFQGLRTANDTLQVSNFVYDPEAIGKTAHDRTIITQYRLGGAEPLQIVDFDDASSRLIRAWAAQQPAPKANVLVIPHHGSRNNQLDPVLSQADRFDVRDVVIAVNRNNQYYHPAPEVLLDLLERLGPDHVFITDSDRGSNVVLDPSGVRRTGGAARNREHLTRFIRAQVQHHATRQRQILEKANATAAGGGVSLVPNSAAPPGFVEHLRETGVLTPREIAILERSYADLDRLRRAADLVEPTAEHRRVMLAALDNGSNPRTLPPGRAGNGPKSGRDGVRAYRERLQELRNESGMTSASSPSGIPSGPNGGGTASGGGTSGQGSASSTASRGGNAGGGSGGVRRGGGPGGGGGGGPRFSGGGSQFRRMLTMPLPGWGGIILGNDPIDDKFRPERLEILMIDDPRDEGVFPQPILRVTLAGGDVADYADLTATELWAAYNFVQPTSRLSERFGPLDELYGNDAGLVGIVENRNDGRWDFALHPAIADTRLAVEAMRVDMSISAAREISSTLGEGGYIHPFVDALPLKGVRFDTYQWYDEQARIFVDDGGLGVEAATAPFECLMRVRLVNTAWPGWAKSEALQRIESGRRFIKRREENPFRNSQEIQREVMNEMRREIDDLTTQDLSLNPHMAELCSAFLPLREIDRIARVIAILNWYRAVSGGGLPPLPDSVNPVFVETPSTWSSNRVFDREYGSEELEELWRPQSSDDPDELVVEEDEDYEHSEDDWYIDDEWEPEPDGDSKVLWVVLAVVAGLVLGLLWLRNR